MDDGREWSERGDGGCVASLGMRGIRLEQMTRLIHGMRTAGCSSTGISTVFLACRHETAISSSLPFSEPGVLSDRCIAYYSLVMLFTS